MTTEIAWDYSGFWTTVLGSRNALAVAQNIVQEHGMPRDRRALRHWLSDAQKRAWEGKGPLPAEWALFTTQALNEIHDALIEHIQA